MKFCLLLSLSALAKETVLLTIHRKDNDKINHLYLNTNSENQLSNIYLDLPGPVKMYDASTIRTGTGIYFQRGIAIISLKSTDLDISLGGHVELSYLSEYKIVGENKYKIIPLKIFRNDQGEWGLYRNDLKVKTAKTYPYTWGIKKFILE